MPWNWAISIESYVACLDIQRKSGGNTQTPYVMFHYNCGLILWKFWKISEINTEIPNILRKGMNTVLRWDNEIWREGGAAIVNQILCRARYNSRSDYRCIKAKLVFKNCSKDFSLSFVQTKYRNSVIWEWKESDVPLPVFTEKNNVSNVWAIKEWCTSDI